MSQPHNKPHSPQVYASALAEATRLTSSLARWKPYERHLTPLFEALGPYAPAGWRERAEA